MVLSPDEAARALVDLANLRGGPDNITALVVEIRSVAPVEDVASTELPLAAASPSPLRSLLWGVWHRGAARGVDVGRGRLLWLGPG